MDNKISGNIHGVTTLVTCKNCGQLIPKGLDKCPKCSAESKPETGDFSSLSAKDVVFTEKTKPSLGTVILFVLVIIFSILFYIIIAKRYFLFPFDNNLFTTPSVKTELSISNAAGTFEKSDVDISAPKKIYNMKIGDVATIEITADEEASLTCSTVIGKGNINLEYAEDNGHRKLIIEALKSGTTLINIKEEGSHEDGCFLTFKISSKN